MGILSRARQSDKPRPWRLGAALISGGILAVQIGLAILDREYDGLGEQLAELHAAALPARGAHAAATQSEAADYAASPLELVRDGGGQAADVDGQAAGVRHGGAA